MYISLVVMNRLDTIGIGKQRKRTFDNYVIVLCLAYTMPK